MCTGSLRTQKASKHAAKTSELKASLDLGEIVPFGWPFFYVRQSTAANVRRRCPFVAGLSRNWIKLQLHVFENSFSQISFFLLCALPACDYKSKMRAFVSPLRSSVVGLSALYECNEQRTANSARPKTRLRRRNSRMAPDITRAHAGRGSYICGVIMGKLVRQSEREWSTACRSKREANVQDEESSGVVSFLAWKTNLAAQTKRQSQRHKKFRPAIPTHTHTHAVLVVPFETSKSRDTSPNKPSYLLVSIRFRQSGERNRRNVNGQ